MTTKESTPEYSANHITLPANKFASKTHQIITPALNLMIILSLHYAKIFQL